MSARSVPRGISLRTGVIKGYVVALAVNRDEGQLHHHLQPSKNSEQNVKVHCGGLKGINSQPALVW